MIKDKLNQNFSLRRENRIHSLQIIMDHYLLLNKNLNYEKCLFILHQQKLHRKQNKKIN